MELQSEAVWAQWQRIEQNGETPNQQFTLPNQSERMASALADAESGGPKANGRVQDTHFLGDYQWDYCRDMAKFAGLYDDAQTAEEIEAYIAMNQALYDYAGKARKELLPGGPDTYRRLKFKRDQAQRRFEVVDPATDSEPVTTGDGNAVTVIL
jgi:hypothetical protein